MTASVAELDAVIAAALAVATCRDLELTKGFAIDPQCPALAAAMAARQAAPNVRAVALASALSASPSPMVRLYLVYALRADALAGGPDAPAAEAAIVAALAGEADDATRWDMLAHLVATKLLAPIRTRAGQLLASALPGERHQGLAMLLTDPLTNEPTTVAALGQLIARDPDVSVRATACSRVDLVDATAMVPQIDATIAEPGVNVTVVSGCVEALATLVGDGKRPAELRAGALDRVLDALETYPRGDAFPTAATLAHLTRAIEPTVLRPTASLDEPWFDRSRLVKVVTSIAGDRRCGALARSAAGDLLTALRDDTPR